MFVAGQARTSPASYRYCLAIRQGFRFLVSVLKSDCHCMTAYRFHVGTIGANLFELLALLLLTLPDELTFHVLYALPRFAERNRTF